MDEIVYAYPITNVVSFTHIARHHVRYLRRYVKIYETDVDSIDIKYWGDRYKLFVHPICYPFFKREEFHENYAKEFVRTARSKRYKLVGFEVADTDELSEQAVELMSEFDLLVFPSTFAYNVYHKSCELHDMPSTDAIVVPHGISDEFKKPSKITDPHLRTLLELKREKNLVFILFQLAHCYDEETRILTKDGFKRYDEITKDDLIATFNMQTEELEYQKPEKIFIYRYDGAMIHFKGQHYDLLVTPNHRMVVRKTRSYITPRLRDKSRKWIIKEAHELLYNDNFRKYEIPRVVKWKGVYKEYFEIEETINAKLQPNVRYKHTKIPMKPFLRFLGWFISEGQARYNEHNREVFIVIWNNNEEYLKEISNTIEEMGYHPTIDRNKGCVIVSSVQLYEIIKSLGLPTHPEIKGRKSHLKFVPNFVKELSPELIKEFLDALWKGDGTYYVTKNGEKIPMKYTTTSKRLAEDIAELLLKCGYAVSINVDDTYRRKDSGRSIIYNVVVSTRYQTPNFKNKPKIIPYKGIVWCVKVPNGAVIVERHGKITICGNSGFRKGADLFVRAMSFVQAKRPNVVVLLKTCELIDPYVHEVEKLKHVRISKTLPLDVYVQLYDISDIVVLTSRGGAFEHNALEGIARGKPTIVPDAGCFKDYIEYTIPVSVTDKRPIVLEHNPIHVGRGWEIDVHELSNRIVEVVDHYDEYRSRFEKFAEIIRKKYSWDKILRKFVIELSKRSLIEIT